MTAENKPATRATLGLRGHLLVLLLFAGLVSLYTWPLARDPGHLLPENHDPRLYGLVMPTIFRNLVSRLPCCTRGPALAPTLLAYV
jgi:hypothetical protein